MINDGVCIGGPLARKRIKAELPSIIVAEPKTLNITEFTSDPEKPEKPDIVCFSYKYERFRYQNKYINVWVPVGIPMEEVEGYVFIEMFNHYKEV